MSILLLRPILDWTSGDSPTTLLHLATCPSMDGGVPVCEAKLNDGFYGCEISAARVVKLYFKRSERVWRKGGADKEKYASVWARNG